MADRHLPALLRPPVCTRTLPAGMLHPLLAQQYGTTDGKTSAPPGHCIILFTI